MKVSRREFLGTVGAGAVALHTKPVRKPNIVLYVVDDLSATDAGCYGNPVIRTPGLDQLAANGTLFTHAFCTTASCSASRSVILTGLHNHANGQYGHMHDFHHFATFDHVQSLPVLLCQAGYRTVRTGKYHVAPEHVYAFDQHIVAEGASPEDRAAQCAPIMKVRDGRPFFLYFCTSEPHRPFVRAGSTPVDPADVLVPSYLPDLPATRSELARYYMSVERADKGLVRLMNLLRTTGHWDNTVIVFLSDNGTAFPGAKTTLYEPGMRLPCVVRRPDVAAGTCEAMISWADLAPTLLDLADVSSVPMHGRSFKVAMETTSPTGWDETYASHTFHEVTMYYPMRVVRTRRHKLLWNIAHGLPYPFATDLHASETWQATLTQGLTHYGRRRVEDYLHRPQFELYDLEQDPHEVDNLVTNTDLLEGLQDKLRSFQQRTGDPWILKWNYE